MEENFFLFFFFIFNFTIIRSRSRSSSSSFEDDFGVKKETLLHGSYADYLKEYSSKGSTKGNVPTMADLATAYQKALTRVASALQHQSSSSKVYTSISLTFLPTQKTLHWRRKGSGDNAT